MGEIFVRASSEVEMIAAGVSLAADLESGDVVALNGQLGAGKTHFSKGIVAGLGSGDEVTSPTFALVQEYHGGSLPVFHFDFYRLDEVSELLRLGWDEYLTKTASCSWNGLTSFRTCCLRARAGLTSPLKTTAVMSSPNDDPRY